MHDTEHIIAIKEHLDEILGEDCEKMPTDEQLDDDDDYIELYHALRALKEAIENVGY